MLHKVNQAVTRIIFVAAFLFTSKMTNILALNFINKI